MAAGMKTKWQLSAKTKAFMQCVIIGTTDCLQTEKLFCDYWDNQGNSEFSYEGTEKSAGRV